MREKWKSKLELKLKDPLSKSNVDKEDIFYFIEDLVKFINTQVSYNIKRLLPADLKEIYTRESDFLETETTDGTDKNPFNESFAITRNHELGGVNVTENVVYDCLLQEQWACEMEETISNTPWECPNCNETKYSCTVFRIMQHEAFCPMKATTKNEVREKEAIVIKPNSRSYHCTVCDKDLFLTPVDILRHKKSCK